MTGHTPGAGPEGALFGESGRREEWTEWGVLYPTNAFLRPPSSVEFRGRLPETAGWMENIRALCASDEARYHGLRGCCVVTRTVVTYTTDWLRDRADRVDGENGGGE